MTKQEEQQKRRLEKIFDLINGYHKEEFEKGLLSAVLYGEEYYKVNPDLTIKLISYEEFKGETEGKPFAFIFPED